MDRIYSLYDGRPYFIDGGTYIGSLVVFSEKNRQVRWYPAHENTTIVLSRRMAAIVLSGAREMNWVISRQA